MDYESTIRLTNNIMFLFIGVRKQEKKRTEGTQIGIDCGYKN